MPTQTMSARWARQHLLQHLRGPRWPRGGDVYDGSLPIYLKPLPQPYEDIHQPVQDAMDYLPSSYTGPMMAAYSPMALYATTYLPNLRPVVALAPAYEWVMHAHPRFNDGNYRDHILHQAFVACVGDWLLDRRIGTKTIWQHCIDVHRADEPDFDALVPLSRRRQFVHTAWWLTALFHDASYPLEFHHDEWERIGESHEVPVNAPTRRGWKGVVADVHTYTPQHTWRVKDGRWRSYHGPVGGANLIEAEEVYRGFADANGREDPAVRKLRGLLVGLVTDAVIQHHSRRDDPLPFAESPLGYLLILADEIQEFGRRKGVPKLSTRRTAVRYPVPVRSVRVTVDQVEKTLALRFRFHKADADLAEWPMPRYASFTDWATCTTPKKEGKGPLLQQSLCCGPGDFLELLLPVTTDPP